MKKFVHAGMSLLAAVGACFLVFLGTKFYYSKQVKTVEVVREVNVEKVVEKEVEISGETIQYNMMRIGKLCTAEYRYTHVEQVESSREIQGFKIPFTTASFIYSYDGNIMAGIDFEEIQIDKNDEEKIITVSLPDAEIISSDVDQDSFKLYDESNNIFNPISISDVADSFADLKKSEEEKAVEEGLLDKARKNAIEMVQNFMRGSYDISDYEIKVSLRKEKQ